MQSPKTYVPINCWKCKTQNNAALNKICRSCGCYLRTGEEIFKKDRYTDPITEHPSFKGFVWSGLAIVLIWYVREMNRRAFLTSF